VAEEAGLVRALIHKLVIVSPAWALTYIMVFVGICSSIAADAGYLVLIPLAAAVFISVGRHPLAGLAASFAGVASVLLLTVVIALITEKMIEPRLGAYIGERPVEEGSGMSPEESRGLRYATYGLVGVIVFFALLTLPPGAPLRNPETGAIIGNSPLMNGLIVAITVLFLVMGMAYDIGAETMKNSADVIGAMTKAVGSLSGFIFLLLIISQFLAYFNYSNMATIAAVKMAPVALAIADDLQASPYPFAMIVALAASTAFMTPISSPVNMLVVAPGNYTFGDFVRIGVPFAMIVMVVSVILVPWLLPLY